MSCLFFFSNSIMVRILYVNVNKRGILIRILIPTYCNAPFINWISGESSVCLIFKHLLNWIYFIVLLPMICCISSRLMRLKPSFRFVLISLVKKKKKTSSEFPLPFMKKEKGKEFPCWLHTYRQILYLGLTDYFTPSITKYKEKKKVYS